MRSWVVVIVSLGLMSVVLPAHAQAGSGHGPSKPISAGLLLGYGLSFEDGPNPWSLGFGVRGGYNLERIYLGARFTYYIGASETRVASGGGTAKFEFNLWELGIEGGYDFAVADKLVVRPELGLGLAMAHSEVTIPFVPGGGGSDTTGKFYLAPGATVAYDIADNIFIGADARFMLILAGSSTPAGSSTVKGLTLLANGGMRF